MAQDETNLNTDIKKEETTENDPVQTNDSQSESTSNGTKNEELKVESIQTETLPQETTEIIVESETQATVEPVIEIQEPKVEETKPKETTEPETKITEEIPQEISTPDEATPAEGNKISKIEEVKPKETSTPTSSAPTGPVHLSHLNTNAQGLAVGSLPQPHPQEGNKIDEKSIIEKFLSKMLNKANLAIQSRNKKRLETLTAFFDNNPRVTNNMVEKLLKVSDSTATDYLQKLVKRGLIIQHGKHGGGVFYTKV